MFEPGRESLFKLTILSDDRDDDGQADFGFQEIKPEEDWRKTTLRDSWSRGGDSAVWPLSTISCRSIGMSGFSRFSRVG